jgi:hypothetical protein
MWNKTFADLTFEDKVYRPKGNRELFRAETLSANPQMDVNFDAECETDEMIFLNFRQKNWRF